MRYAHKLPQKMTHKIANHIPLKNSQPLKSPQKFPVSNSCTGSQTHISFAAFIVRHLCPQMPTSLTLPMATVLLCCFCHATDDASNTAHAWIKGPQESKPDPEYNYEPTLPYPCALPVLCGLSGNHLDLCLFLCLEGLHAIFKFFGQGSFFCNDRWPDIHLASDNVLAGYQHKPQIARELWRKHGQQRESCCSTHAHVDINSDRCIGRGHPSPIFQFLRPPMERVLSNVHLRFNNSTILIHMDTS